MNTTRHRTGSPPRVAPAGASRSRHLSSHPRVCLASAAAALAGALVAPALSFAQEQPCRPGDAVLSQLPEKFGESPIAAGALKAGSLIITENPETHSWTVLVSRPDGSLCMMAEGDGWTALAPVAPKKGSPA